MEFLQGNTYLINAKFYNQDTGSEISGARVVKAEFVFNNLHLTYGLEDSTVTYDSSRNVFVIGLTEVQTLAFRDHIRYQSKALLDDGSVCGSVEECSYLYDTLCTTVLSEEGDVGEENSRILRLNLINVSGGTDDYEQLINKPRINDVELIGNKTSEDLGLASDADVQGLEQRVTGIENDVETISQEIDDIQDDINNINNDITTINSNIQTLSNGLQEAEQDIQEINTEIDSISEDVSDLQNGLQQEITNRQTADNNLQGQIDAIVSKSDVVDIVGTYNELLSYDTTKLGDNDVVKVLTDSTHENARSYYRWKIISGVGSWNYVGSEAVGYTKAEEDALLNQKQGKIDSSHKLNADLVDDNASTNKFVTANEKAQITTNANNITTIQNAYLKNATVLDDTLTITKQDGTTIEFQGGSVEVDNITIDKNAQDQLEVKDGGITNAKLNSEVTNVINAKQNITDNTLQTTNKTIPNAINEVNTIAKGAQQAISYNNYQAMVTAFNALASGVYNVGQNIMIVTLEVPDLWVSSVETTSQTYTYTTDEAITTALQTDGYIQVGYYKLSALETGKVDLTNYVQKTTTIAGIDLEDNISASELRTALNTPSFTATQLADGSYSITIS